MFDLNLVGKITQEMGNASAAPKKQLPHQVSAFSNKQAGHDEKSN